MTKIGCVSFGLLLLLGCGGAANGVGALCRQPLNNQPVNVVTCATGLTCCGGPPDTGGYCQAPDGGALCPAGGQLLL